jgi:hypothetical protein
VKKLALAAILIQSVYFASQVTLDFSAADRIQPKAAHSGIDVNPVPERVASEHGLDLATVHLPNRLLLADAIRARKMPGSDFIGEWETAAFYPVNWVYAFLPVKVALGFETLFHLLLAAAGVFYLCRLDGRSPQASALGAFCFAVSGPVWGRLYPGHLSNLAAVAWIPWVFFAALSVSRRPSWASFLGLQGVLLVFFLSGHPQYIFYTAMAVVVLVVTGWLSVRSVPYLAAAAALASVWAAPQLLPAVDAYRHSVRLAAPYVFSSSFYLPIDTALTAVNPFQFGPFDHYRIPSLMNAWETSYFFGGVGALWLAYRGAAWRILAPVLLFLVLAFGVQTPVYDLLYQTVPVFSSFRGVGKFFVFAVLFLCLAVARGWDR